MNVSSNGTFRNCSKNITNTCKGVAQWSKNNSNIYIGSLKIFDAKGKKINGSMFVSYSNIKISVPNKNLVNATYPITIDPEIGTDDFRISDAGTNGDATRDVESVAVAYNDIEEEYLVVWSADDNQTTLADGEFEIYGQRIDANTGAELGTNDFRISDMGPDNNAQFDAVSPSVAFNSANNEYLVVWEGDDNQNGFVEHEEYGVRE
jgi:hypothetical protein